MTDRGQIQYQLLDFGEGRRLERFGPVVLDRPCPAAEGMSRAAPALWAGADARFERTAAERGEWRLRGQPPERWNVAWGRLDLELKRTEFGHVGLFPEQAANWAWIAERIAMRRTSRGVEGDSPIFAGCQPQEVANKLPAKIETVPKVLNLFAYTGAGTLAAAAAGAEVTHVDAARNVVAWARRNAELSQLAEAPIRWIAEDARKFVAREVRRKNRYDAVVLDPPSYGHGPRGEVWRLADDLPPLLTSCSELTGPRPLFILLTCHTPGHEAGRLAELLAAAWPELETARIEALPLILPCGDGRALPSGEAARYG